MRRPEIIERIKEAADKMRPEVQTILYGSEARGDARPDSDIDLLLLVNTDKKLTYSDKERYMSSLYDIELESGVIISTLIMPKKEWEQRPYPTPFYNNVMKDGITI
ncbi:MAG: nucleotidyltransferase domain-containing protein [Bacteroidales bacterium]|nr:nucleotidyltransferase domain-containing protein [Bacteroidales bacterium]